MIRNKKLSKAESLRGQVREWDEGNKLEQRSNARHWEAGNETPKVGKDGHA